MGLGVRINLEIEAKTSITLFKRCSILIGQTFIVVTQSYNIVVESQSSVRSGVEEWDGE